MPRIKIEVTATDIRRARRMIKSMARAKCCPVALAIKRAFRDDGVRVFKEEVRLSDIKLTLPDRARSFVNHFDNDEKVKPFSFMLKKP